MKCDFCDFQMWFNHTVIYISEYCHDTKTSSMSRTTGYTATAAANLFLDGLFDEKGVFPPELVTKRIHEALELDVLLWKRLFTTEPLLY
mgnify:CR=1 FL=1